MLLKGEKHYDSQSNLDNLPLLNPDVMKNSSVVDEIYLGTSRSATRQLKAILDVEQHAISQSENISAWSSLSDLSESSDEEKVVEEDSSKKSRKAQKTKRDTSESSGRGKSKG
jgi:hypothetical protein